jgi:hypothetical protein
LTRFTGYTQTVLKFTKLITEAQESQNLFLLTEELKQLQPGLIQFCNYIFSRSVYHEPFIFHGLALGGTITGATVQRADYPPDRTVAD